MASATKEKTKICANHLCQRKFTPAVHWQLYCDKTCGNRVRVRNHVARMRKALRQAKLDKTR